MVNIVEGQYYNFSTIAPEYLRANYTDMKCIGAGNTWENLNGNDTYQVWNILKDRYTIIDYKLERFVTFKSRDGEKITFGRSWLVNVEPTSGIGRVRFEVDDCNIEDIQLIREQLMRIGKKDFIVEKVN